MDVVDFWVRSWTSDDRVAVRHLLAPDAEVEWNLDAPVDDEELAQTLHRIAVFAAAVTVVAGCWGGGGAAVGGALAAPLGRAGRFGSPPAGAAPPPGGGEFSAAP